MGGAMVPLVTGRKRWSLLVVPGGSRSGFPGDFRRRRRFGCHQWRSGSVGLIGLCLRLDFAGKGNRVATGKWK
ncbi:hypothetical protein KY284_035755 [Solanum tuberosum]|nr:hypothetical protein KY284_035755 [Solanum tuberosum]